MDIGCGGYFKSLLCEIWLSINAKGIREQSDERKTGKLNKYEGEYEREREREESTVGINSANGNMRVAFFLQQISTLLAVFFSFLLLYIIIYII